MGGGGGRNDPLTRQRRTIASSYTKLCKIRLLFPSSSPFPNFETRYRIGDQLKYFLFRYSSSRGRFTIYGIHFRIIIICHWLLDRTILYLHFYCSTAWLCVRRKKNRPTSGITNAPLNKRFNKYRGHQTFFHALPPFFLFLVSYPSMDSRKKEKEKSESLHLPASTVDFVEIDPHPTITIRNVTLPRFCDAETASFLQIRLLRSCLTSLPFLFPFFLSFFPPLLSPPPPQSFFAALCSFSSFSLSFPPSAAILDYPLARDHLQRNEHEHTHLEEGSPGGENGNSASIREKNHLPRSIYIYICLKRIILWRMDGLGKVSAINAFLFKQRRWN